MTWGALVKSAGKKALMESGKKVAENIAKKATEKKSKVKGKDIAKKMLGGGDDSSEKGGALVVRPSSSIVSSPAGDLVPTKADEGGSLVVKSSTADELGLTPFMESVTSIKESVKSIKGALNNNLEDAEKRLEKQRLLNASLSREEQEEELETKKSGIGKKLLKPVKDVGENFLQKLKRFFMNTLLGMFVNALIGGSRDVVVAFIAGYKAYRMASDAARRFVFKLGTKISRGIKGLPGKLKSTGKAIFEFLKGTKNTLVAWIKGTARTVKNAVKGTFEFVNKLRKTPVRETVKAVQNTLRNTVTTIRESGVGRKVGDVINKGKNIWSKIRTPGKTAGNILGGIRNWGARKWKGAVEFGSKKWKQLTTWADDLWKSASKWTDDIVKGGLEKAKKWRKQLGDMAEMVRNPAKLAEKVKGMLSGQMDELVKKNDIIKKVKDLAKDPKKAVDGIKKFVKQVGKNKNVLKTRKVLQKAAKLKIAGIDAVLAALMGIIDYTAFGESPINAVLRAAGSLIGYTAGFAIGAPFGGVPGFITGMAGGWVGEKAADLIAAGLSKTEMGSTPDPIMNDGRMLVRNPFSGQGEGERMDNIQESKAELGETKVDDVSQDISSSASYEEGAEDETVVIDAGGDQGGGQEQSQVGKVEFIDVGVDKETILNSNYQAQTNAVLYKV